MAAYFHRIFPFLLKLFFGCFQKFLDCDSSKGGKRKKKIKSLIFVVLKLNIEHKLKLAYPPASEASRGVY